MKKTGPGAFLSFLAIRSIFAIMQCFPIEWNLQTARILARIWPIIMPRHRQRAIAHLSDAFHGQLSLSRISQLANRCLASVTMFAVEAICLPRLITPFTWSRYITPVEFQETLKLILDGKGVIMVTGHYGSFEVMGHLLSALGFRTAAVMRPLDNVYLNRFLVATRKANGLMLLDKVGATAQAEELLKQGTLLCFIGDQDAGRKGIFVDFFGKQASTYKSIGLLAMSANVPIVVGFARRKRSSAHYEVGVQRIIRPCEWEQQEDPLRWITQTYTAAIEESVRVDPAQYLWIHRRWKSRPRPERQAQKTETAATAN